MALKTFARGTRHSPAFNDIVTSENKIVQTTAKTDQNFDEVPSDSIKLKRISQTRQNGGGGLQGFPSCARADRSQTPDVPGGGRRDRPGR